MEDSVAAENREDQIKTEENLKELPKDEDSDQEEEKNQSEEDEKNKTQLNGHTDLKTDTDTLSKDEVSIKPKTHNDLMKERIESDIIIEQPPAEPPQDTSKPSDYGDFAAIHSFLTMFGVELDLPNVSLIDLEQIFSTSHQLSIDKGEKSFLFLDSLIRTSFNRIFL